MCSGQSVKMCLSSFAEVGLILFFLSLKGVNFSKNRTILETSDKAQVYF